MSFENKTLGEVAGEYPEATYVFIEYDIDFVPGGADRNFTEACRSRGLEPGDVEHKIKNDAGKQPRLDAKLANFSTPELIQHIRDHHHAYIRSRQVPMTMLAQQVAAAHSENHSELNSVAQSVQNIFDDLEQQMRQEEDVIFPALLALDEHEKTGAPIPQLRYGSIDNPIATLQRDHAQTAERLGQLRKRTDSYTCPGDACDNYRKLYKKLMELHANVFMYLHIENNVLFPRMLDLEKRIKNGEDLTAEK